MQLSYMRLYLIGYICCVLQDFDFLSVPISLGDIREKISMFIMSQIVEEEGEFYDPASCK
jgi:hypothetical protein